MSLGVLLFKEKLVSFIVLHSFISEFYKVLIEIFYDFRYREKGSNQICNQFDRKKLGLRQFPSGEHRNSCIKYRWPDNTFLL